MNSQGNWTANLGIATMRGEYTTDWSEISAAATFVAIRSCSFTCFSNATWSVASLPARRSRMARISIEEVHKSYRRCGGTQAFSLEIADGEFVVLVGPSGMWQVDDAQDPGWLGARLPAAGCCWAAVMSRMWRRGERDVAMVFQNYALYPHLTVRRILASACGCGRCKAGNRQAGGRGRQDSRRRTPAQSQAESAVGRPKAESCAWTGDRQGAAGVPDGRASVQSRRQTAGAYEGGDQRLAPARPHPLTTVYVTHDQIEAMTMADRVVLMREGEIQQIADPDTLFQQPKNLFVAGFIGSPGMNLVEVDVVEEDRRSRA